MPLGAPELTPRLVLAPALPKMAELLVQVRLAKLASTTRVTLEVTCVEMISAALIKDSLRCAPTVVPLLPSMAVMAVDESKPELKFKVIVEALPVIVQAPLPALVVSLEAGQAAANASGCKAISTTKIRY